MSRRTERREARRDREHRAFLLEQAMRDYQRTVEAERILTFAAMDWPREVLEGLSVARFSSPADVPQPWRIHARTIFHRNTRDDLDEVLRRVATEALEINGWR